MSRLSTFIWLFYAIAFGIVFDSPKSFLLIFLILPFVLSPSPFFWVREFTPEQREVPWVLWGGFYKTINFIENNISEDAVFLIDGGGIGCTGASANYGERIFPLTSRKIFYFTDTCWAQYDMEDYEKKVDIYNKISINPDDKRALELLKSYNVTHVYVGPYSIGLNSTLFLNSKHYSEVFRYGNTHIFQID